MWKSRVLPGLVSPPLRDVPPRWMTKGLPLNKLTRWGGSWPCVTRTCRDTETGQPKVYWVKAKNLSSETRGQEVRLEADGELSQKDVLRSRFKQRSCDPPK